jgi:hypothetical protein
LLGYTVWELQSKMTSREFAEWLARGRIMAEEQEQAEMVSRVEGRMQQRKTGRP